MSGPAAIVFDATGTLIEATAPIGETYHRVALAHGVDLPAWRLEDAFHRVLALAPPRGVDGGDVAAREVGERAWWTEIIRQTFQATDSTARFEDFTRFADALFETYRARDAWRLRPGVADLLADLRVDGLRLAIASNFDHRLPSILEHLEIETFFEAIALPSEVGARKPDPAVFRWLAERLAVAIEDLRYVGDDAPEVLDAIRLAGPAVADVRVLGRPVDWKPWLVAPTTKRPSR